MNHAPNSMMRLVAAVTRKSADGQERTWWTRIGTAFLNSDGSYNLRYDFVPTNFPNTTMQMRPFRTREEDESTDEEVAAAS